ncbi:uncharacterized protein SPAPADRAFT_57190 [Spathaspora passalidarum NRRL Y-27907]|uniref:Uncharacterized protein n=1 Tax=Spathaspora passalidarum (strain NRRL Y-27907 / 11-Y1) TaxID=619300 RepID=G3AU23_SPAPN|nr:uncharacterized protein SPAPADRAFT_57190 [Spathaspora passalidarum NRRL Y-27907]EGW30399.1 hypothetical protein SPAPADRAFT_57190 [Spathaspora passalidarum NRRL Y-27907]
MSLPLSEKRNDLEKSSLSPISSASSSSHLHPAPKRVYQKLISALIIETIISCAIYINYDTIGAYHPMLAGLLLGCSSGALAQSMNQYAKKKFTLQKILKFMLWGSINGYFTVGWINILITRIDNSAYRIIIDQLVGAPMFQLIFNMLNSIWDHGEMFSISTRLAYVKSLKYSYCFWPFFSILEFMFIPQALMFPCNCLANLLWNLILCRLA